MIDTLNVSFCSIYIKPLLALRLNYRGKLNGAGARRREANANRRQWATRRRQNLGIDSRRGHRRELAITEPVQAACVDLTSTAYAGSSAKRQTLKSHQPIRLHTSVRHLKAQIED